MAHAAPRDNVVAHYIVASPPAKDRGAAYFVKDIPDNLCPADEIVQIHAVRPNPKQIRSYVMNEIIADDVSAVPPVTAGIDRPCVAGMLANPRNLVELDYVVVS